MCFSDPAYCAPGPLACFTTTPQEQLLTACTAAVLQFSQVPGTGLSLYCILDYSAALTPAVQYTVVGVLAPVAAWLALGLALVAGKLVHKAYHRVIRGRRSSRWDTYAVTDAVTMANTRLNSVISFGASQLLGARGPSLPGHTADTHQQMGAADASGVDPMSASFPQLKSLRVSSPSDNGQHSPPPQHLHAATAQGTATGTATASAEKDATTARVGLPLQLLILSITCMFFFYPTVVNSLMSIFVCVEVDKPGAVASPVERLLGLTSGAVWKRDYSQVGAVTLAVTASAMWALL